MKATLFIQGVDASKYKRPRTHYGGIMTEDTDDDTPELTADSDMDDIWITSKVRMVAERRYKKYAFWSHILLTYYALMVIIISLLERSNGDISENTIFLNYNIVISIILLIFTLITYGFKFEEQSYRHRDCYLRLQRLLKTRGRSSTVKVHEKYMDILEGYPNHADIDYEVFLYNHIIVQKKELTFSGNKVKLTCYNWISIGVRTFFYYGVIGVLIYFPLRFITSYG